MSKRVVDNMELICPLCNGLINYEVNCPTCGSEMSNQGPVVDYLDEYSPYLSNSITQKVDGVPQDQCVHLYQCEKCNRDKRIIIDRVKK